MDRRTAQARQVSHQCSPAATVLISQESGDQATAPLIQRGQEGVEGRVPLGYKTLWELLALGTTASMKRLASRSLHETPPS